MMFLAARGLHSNVKCAGPTQELSCDHITEFDILDFLQQIYLVEDQISDLLSRLNVLYLRFAVRQAEEREWGQVALTV